MESLNEKYGTQFIDALPYADEPMDQYEKQVDALIRSEMKKFPSPDISQKFPPVELKFSVRQKNEGAFFFIKNLLPVKNRQNSTFLQEETEIIKGEVVELSIDRPATGAVKQQQNATKISTSFQKKKKGSQNWEINTQDH